MQKIYWHGTTSKKKVQSILKNGFNKGTWFACHLEDALEFGGKYVFAVVIEWEKKIKTWQICADERIPPDTILRVEKFTVEKIYENEKPSSDFFEKEECYAHYSKIKSRVF